MRYILTASVILFMMLEIGLAQDNKVQIANLNNGADTEAFQSIKNAFQNRNPGYEMTWYADVLELGIRAVTQVAFVQRIDGVTNQDVVSTATILDAEGNRQESEVIVGDILILYAGERLQTSSEVGFLVFEVPVAPEHKLPSFIRPDWDPNITDVPGGCATEIDAYRRILLTWKEDVGEYIYHALNAHRVRIYDSFSHYHPVQGGFDEFYLVQMSVPGAKIITSEYVHKITRPDMVKPSELDGMIQEYELNVGDLVYLPKGVMHRGLDGVVTQVITMPGFIPGSEIGVDHHLRAINERLGLSGGDALPFNVEHSHEAVIR